jgi:protoheme IX farnesyltransferase
MWFDRDIDDKMSRTRLRPVPAGRLAPAAALAFGLGLAAFSFAIFWRFANPLSAWLALGGLLFYVLIYTVWLKRSTPQNIVIGGAAGAFPPLVGYAAVAGRLVLSALYLFAIIFYWTPPHFWALALLKKGEYARAGVPMLPVVRGVQETKVQMLIYTLILLPLTICRPSSGRSARCDAGGDRPGWAVPVVQPPAAPRDRCHPDGVEDVSLLPRVPRPALRRDGCGSHPSARGACGDPRGAHP